MGGRVRAAALRLARRDVAAPVGLAGGPPRRVEGFRRQGGRRRQVLGGRLGDRPAVSAARRGDDAGAAGREAGVEPPTPGARRPRAPGRAGCAPGAPRRSRPPPPRRPGRGRGGGWRGGGARGAWGAARAPQPRRKASRRPRSRCRARASSAPGRPARRSRGGRRRGSRTCRRRRTGRWGAAARARVGPALPAPADEPVADAPRGAAPPPRRAEVARENRVDPGLVALGRRATGAGGGGAGDMSDMPAYLDAVLRPTPSSRAASAPGTPLASVSRMSCCVRRGAAIFPSPSRAPSRQRFHPRRALVRGGPRPCPRGHAPPPRREFRSVPDARPAHFSVRILLGSY